MPLLPHGALPKLFPTLLLRPPCRRFHIASPQRSSTHAISHAFPSVHLDVASVPLLPNGALPNLFPTLLLRPPCRRFRIAPSQRGSPHAISHASPSVHLVVASVSLLPNGALPKLFPMVSFVHPLVISVSLLPHGALPKLFPTVTLSVHPLVASVSLLPNGALPMGFPSVYLVAASVYRSFPTELSPFPTISFPFTLSSLPCIAPSQRSSPAISYAFLSIHPLVASVSLLPNGALPMLFPTRFPSVLLVVASVALLPSGALPMLFPTVSLSSLPYRSFPNGAHPKLFPRASFPSTLLSLLPNGALLMLFPTLSPPSTLSSLPFRSFPTELSRCYFPRFLFPSTASSIPYIRTELSPCYI